MAIFLTGVLILSGCSSLPFGNTTLQSSYTENNHDPSSASDSSGQGDKEGTTEENQDTAARKSTSILKLFQTAVEPVGSTLYIWGGGWNEEDTGGGIESVTLGVSPQWKTFYDNQDAYYDYSLYPYEIHEGLDCSGYIGWLIYNALETEDNQASYVTHSPNQTQLLADRGLGKVIPYSEIQDVLPGDIFNSQDHIYMVVKGFEDGSRLIIHATPPGVQFSGTPDANGSADSEAVYWARDIMSNWYPDYYERYPVVTVDGSYNYFDQFRFFDDVVTGMEQADRIKIEELIPLVMQFSDETDIADLSLEQDEDSFEQEELETENAGESSAG